MTLPMHPAFERLVAKARASHARGRSPEGITPEDVTRARLYCYALRMHTIGAFHATQLALEGRPEATGTALLHRRRALETLCELADMGMEDVPRDFRAVVSTFYRYHTGVLRVLESCEEDARASGDERVAAVAHRFTEIIGEIAGGNGLHLTRDTGAPEQAAFIVPNLGITIVPLVYGDHHSWALAYLVDAAGQMRDVPVHRHHRGVEIHLGYEPIRGVTILGDCAAEVAEGYAMPIPPMTAHGFVNTADAPHHVPFIFGSLEQAGWGVFLDVEPQPCDLEQLRKVPVESEAMNGTIYLEREIAAAADSSVSLRRTLIPAACSDRDATGGLELSIARVGGDGLEFAPSEDFRIVSVVRGAGAAQVQGIERRVEVHDHYGIPDGMTASLHQTSTDPLVALDAVIRSAAGDSHKH